MNKEEIKIIEVNVRDLIKGDSYINQNTGNKFVFKEHFQSGNNIYAVDTEGMTHICQNFRKQN